MANVICTPIEIVKNIPSADITMTTGTVIDETKTMTVVAGKEGKTVLMVNNSAVAEKDLTVKAGAYMESCYGDLVVPVGAGETVVLVLNTSRFEQADETFLMSFEAGFTGFVSAIVVPN